MSDSQGQAESEKAAAPAGAAPQTPPVSERAAEAQAKQAAAPAPAPTQPATGTVGSSPAGTAAGAGATNGGGAASSAAESPADAAALAAMGLSPDDIKALENYVPPQSASAAAADASQTQSPAGSPRRRLSLAHALLGANTLVLIVLALGSLGIVPRRGEPSRAAAAPTIVVMAAASAPATSAPAPASAPATAIETPAKPIVHGSWKQAETAFATGDYDRAIGIYNGLSDVSQGHLPDPMVAEMLHLRIAQCQERKGTAADAIESYGQLLSSGYPIIRVLANYQLAQLLAEQGQPQQARMRAYAALCYLPLLERPMTVEADCDYLLSRALTQEVLSLFDNAPVVAWPGRAKTNLLAGLSEEQLRRTLQEGADTLSSAVMGVKIRRSTVTTSKTWVVECSQACLEDVLSQFSMAADLPLEWSEVSPAARQRTVSLFVRDASAQRVIELACGAAGLIARFTGDKVVVYDSQSCKTAAQRRDLLHKEATSTWWRFALRHADDRRNMQAQRCLGALLECAGDANGAIGEYQFVAKTYARESDAASALLACVRLRVRMKDFSGAQQDLMTLLDSYPDCPHLDEVYGTLGQARLEEGQVEEALLVFHKLYFLDLSQESKAQAALGLGKCHLLKGSYDDACQWLTQYVPLARGRKGMHVSECYLLLGRAQERRGRLAEAAKAFAEALRLEPAKAQRVEAMFELAGVQARQGNYPSAIGSAFAIETAELTAAQFVDLLLLKSKIFRQMNLPERSLAVLKSGLDDLKDPEAIASTRLEMARCHAEMGQDEEAFDLLAEIIPRLPAGATAHEAMCDLAEVCLRLGRQDNAISVLEELMRLDVDPATRKRASETLGKAYLAKQDFERAAQAFGNAPKSEKSELADLASPAAAGNDASPLAGTETATTKPAFAPAETGAGAAKPSQPQAQGSATGKPAATPAALGGQP